ncbi:MAG: AAA family ATPase [Clostridia bacterium]|nr:AAA family ATPase [Clostridia bacterium]
MIRELHISGFRGFGKEQQISFAIPDGQTQGSGLSIITGANNSGKTTIIEAIQAFNCNSNNTPTFSEGRRNCLTGGKVFLKLIDDSSEIYTIESVPSGGSSTKKNKPFTLKYYVLQSRRAIPFEFSKTNVDKEWYILHSQKLDNQRSSSLSNFEARIFQIEKQKDEFDLILSKVLGNDFCWTIEQRDNGSYYIKYSINGISHSSEGIGDGIWSVFTICAALFDSKTNETIVIDEPELSVHPKLQKKLMEIFLEYSTTRQIIISTHSPYFVNWNAIINNANLIRVTKDNQNSVCFSISENTRKQFKGILNDINNPHTLGLDANEIFFLDDGIILVEGQEDVVILDRISKELEMEIDGTFFGWGVGGAPKMEAFLHLFKDLGYKRVVVILDGDKSKEAEILSEEFAENNYKIITLVEDDIRDKKDRSIKGKVGITFENGKLKDKYREYAQNLIRDINSAL